MVLRRYGMIRGTKGPTQRQSTSRGASPANAPSSTAGGFKDVTSQKDAETRTAISKESADVAVVGGGIAGLFCAYLLALNGKSVHVFEATERPGGRIRTIRLDARNEEIPGVSGGDKQRSIQQFYRVKKNTDLRDTMEFHVEFGPMRLELETQYLLDTLLKKLDFRPYEPGSDKAADDIEDFPSYASPTSSHDPSYQVQPGEEGKDPLELFELALLRIMLRLYFPKASNATADDLKKDHRATDGEDFLLIKTEQRDFDDRVADDLWKRLIRLREEVTLRTATGESLRSSLQAFAKGLDDKHRWTIATHTYIDGVPLYTLGFWNLVSQYLSHDAMLKVRDLGTFYHLLDENPNASEWLTWWLAGLSISDRLKGIAGGMETIVDKLTHQLQNAKGSVAIFNKCKVVRLSRPEIAANQNDAPKDGHRLTMTVGADSTETTSHPYKHVILAIPKLPLQSLVLQSLECFEERKRNQIMEWLDSAHGFPLVKAFCVVDNRWWEEEIRTNQFATRMPTRELHYWKGNTPRSRQGLIMVYTDRPASAFWNNYVKSGPHTDVAWYQSLGDPRREDPFHQRTRLKEKLADYIRTADAPDFSAEHIKWVAIRDWGRDPYGGNHAWRPKRKYWLVMQRLSKLPLTDRYPTATVHICGEAYSDYHGFIEGALRSSVYALSHILGNSESAIKTWLGLLKPEREDGETGKAESKDKFDESEFDKRIKMLSWWIHRLNEGDPDASIYGLAEN